MPGLRQTQNKNMAFGQRLDGISMKKWAIKNKEDGKYNETMG